VRNNKITEFEIVGSDCSDLKKCALSFRNLKIVKGGCNRFHTGGISTEDADILCLSGLRKFKAPVAWILQYHKERTIKPKFNLLQR